MPSDFKYSDKRYNRDRYNRLIDLKGVTLFKYLKNAGTRIFMRIMGALHLDGDLTVGGNNIKDRSGKTVISFNNTGGIDKIGDDTPSSGQYLKWDGNKAVWDGVSGAVSGSNNQLLTDAGDGTIASESYLTFENSSNISTLEILSNEDTGDKCSITTTTHGATTITTTDDDATAAHFEIAADGDIILDAAVDIDLECNDLNCNASNIYFSSSGPNRPSFQLTNNADDATAPFIIFKNNRDGNGLEDDDVLGTVRFDGEDASGTFETYGSIIGSVAESANSDEAGQIVIMVANDGTERNGITITADKTVAEQVDVTIANGQNSLTTIPGNIQVKRRKMPLSSTTTHDHNGDVVFFGTGSTTQGEICYLNTDGSNNPVWTAAQANAESTSTSLLAIALGTTPATHGMLLRGMVTLDHNTGDNNYGTPVYLSDTVAGNTISTAPSSNNDVVRVIGYKMGNDDEMWFCPDNTWVVVSA